MIVGVASVLTKPTVVSWQHGEQSIFSDCHEIDLSVRPEGKTQRKNIKNQDLKGDSFKNESRKSAPEFLGGFTITLEKSRSARMAEATAPGICLLMDAPLAVLSAVSYTHLTLPTTPYV